MTGERTEPARGPTVDQARAFCAVATSRTYREAAERLGLEPHVLVIRRVNRFRDALGRDRLVTARYTGEVTLTAAGTDVYPFARRFVQAADALVRSSREGVRIRFSTYPAIMERVARDVPALLEEFPIELYDVTEASRRDSGRGLVQRTADGEIDLAIAPAHLTVSGFDELEEHVLYEWALRVILPFGHDLGNEDHVSPRMLAAAGLDVVAAPRGHHSRELLESAYASDASRLSIELEATDQALLREIARNSRQLVAVLPDDMDGKPDVTLGPELISSTGRRYTGSYSLYYRRANTVRDQIIGTVAATVRASFV